MADAIDIKTEEPQFKNVMFISDLKLNDEIKKELYEWSSIRNYSNQFTNRTIKELYDCGIEHIWINIDDTDARHWLEQNIKKNTHYTTVLVYKGHIRNLFLIDLKEHVQTTIRLKDLKKLKSLTFDELLHKIDNIVKIHSPASCLSSIIGCGNLTPDIKNA